MKNIRRALTAVLIACFVVQSSVFAYIEKNKDDSAGISFDFNNPDDLSKFLLDKVDGLSMGVGEYHGSSVLKLTRTGDDGIYYGPAYLLQPLGFYSGTVKISMRAYMDSATSVTLNIDDKVSVYILKNGHPSGGFFAKDKNNGSVHLGGKTAYYPIMGKFVNLTFEYNLDNGSLRVFEDGAESAACKNGAAIDTGIKSIKKIKIGMRANDGVANCNFYIDNFKVEKETLETNKTLEDTQYTHNKNKLKYLGVLDKSADSVNMTDFLTRIQFVAMASRLAGVPKNEESGEIFSDLHAKTEDSSYLENAYVKGYIKDINGKIKPNENITLSEAIELLEGLSGNIYKDEKGNTRKYYDIYSDLIKGINVKSGEQYLSMNDAVTLLDNCLYVRVMNYRPFNNNEGINLLYRVYKLKEEKVFIEKVNYVNANITVTDISGNNPRIMETKDCSLINAEGTYRKIWLNDDDEVVYMIPVENSLTIYGYVDSYNGGECETLITPRRIKNIKLSVLDEEIKSRGDFEMFSKGKEVTDEIYLTGAFVRLTINNNNIRRMDIFDMSEASKVIEGGIIKQIGNNKILYTQGDNTPREMVFSDYDEFVTVLNGVEISFDKLPSGCVFDYFVKDNYLYLLCSDLKYEGVLSGVGENSQLIMGNREIQCSDKILYISSDGGEHYKSDKKITDMMGKDIAALCDIKGQARYVSSMLGGVYYGVVLSGWTDEMTDENMLKLSILFEGSMDKKTLVCDLRKGNTYYPEINFETALSNAKTKNGIYKFHIKNGKIKKIEAIEWADGGNMKAISGINGALKRIEVSGNGMYYGDNMISLKDCLGDFNPQVVSANVLSDKSTNSVSAIFENTKPTSDLVVFDNAFEGFYDGSIRQAFVSNRYEELRDDEIYICYRLETRDSVLIKEVLQQYPLEFSQREIQKGDILIYSPNSLRTEQGKMTIFKVIPYKDIQWGDFSYSNDYQYAQQRGSAKYIGVITGIDGQFIKVAGQTGEEWYRLGTAHKFLEYKNNKTYVREDYELLGKKAFVCTYLSDVIQIMLVEE